MDTEVGRDKRLVETLSDAMWALIWAAVLTYAVVWLSFGMFLAMRGETLASLSAWCGVTSVSMSIIWMAGLALVKLTALTLAVMAFGLWVWRRRVLRRIEAVAPSA